MSASCAPGNGVVETQGSSRGLPVSHVRQEAAPEALTAAGEVSKPWWRRLARRIEARSVSHEARCV